MISLGLTFQRITETIYLLLLFLWIFQVLQQIADFLNDSLISQQVFVWDLACVSSWDLIIWLNIGTKLV
jgi:hypothetical protein